MIRLLYLGVLLVGMYACSSSNTHTPADSYEAYTTLEEELDSTNIDCLSDTLSLPITPLSSDKVGEYTGDVQKLYHHMKADIPSFIHAVMNCEDGVDSIVVKDSIAYLYLIQDENVNYFEEAGNLIYSWKYYYFHDIYYSFFSFPEIVGISVWNGDTPYSILPASGEIDDLRLPHNTMKREWYLESLDYADVIDIENEAHFDHYQDGIVAEQVLNNIR